MTFGARCEKDINIYDKTPYLFVQVEGLCRMGFLFSVDFFELAQSLIWGDAFASKVLIENLEVGLGFGIFILG